MRVHVVDPSAYTPPYDRALCAALAAEGLDVTLVTSRFGYGDVPPARGFAVDERFYRLAVGAPAGRLRLASKLAQHVPDMLRYRRRAEREADVVHFQWLAVQHVDGRLLPRRPTVLTAHDVLPREPRPGQLRAQRALYERVEAVVVHSEHGRARLVEALGTDPERVHVIPHGAFEHLDAVAPVLPPELAGADPDAQVVLFCGLLRPYKGLDVLLGAWDAPPGAELWIVGMPRMDTAPLRAAAGARVRFVERFVSDGELAGCLRRADLVVLPYREIDQSGVLFAALGLGRPLLLSAVGGFPEVARAGAARLVTPGDAEALRGALHELLADEPARQALAAGARRAAHERFSWAASARAHARLYRSLRG